MKKINLFIIWLIFFSFSIFFLKDYFFWMSEDEINRVIENNYIEPSFTKNEYILDKKSIIKENYNDNIKISLQSAYNIDYIYYPETFEWKINEYVSIFKVFLNNKSIISKIDDLKVEFHQEKNDIRGKMKNHSIKLFWVEQMEIDECNAVWIHEFWHFVDLYFLKKWIYTDLSDYFYNISWESTKVMKPWQEQSDFVSWYSMTNKYEDFAESFAYFVLHNEDFLSKSSKSEVLRKKYDYFIKYLFRDWEFVWTDFSVDNELLDYYRDITKIDFSLENFLEFLKK